MVLDGQGVALELSLISGVVVVVFKSSCCCRIRQVAIRTLRRDASLSTRTDSWRRTLEVGKVAGSMTSGSPMSRLFDLELFGGWVVLAAAVVVLGVDDSAVNSGAVQDVTRGPFSWGRLLKSKKKIREIHCQEGRSVFLEEVI